MDKYVTKIRKIGDKMINCIGELDPPTKKALSAQYRRCFQVDFKSSKVSYITNFTHKSQGYFHAPYEEMEPECPHWTIVDSFTPGLLANKAFHNARLLQAERGLAACAGTHVKEIDYVWEYRTRYDLSTQKAVENINELTKRMLVVKFILTKKGQ